MEKISNPKIRKLIYDKFNGKCAYCGNELNGKFTVDHIEPRLRYIKSGREDYYQEKKGDDKIHNFNPCCQSCNSSKWSYDIETWREHLYKKTKMLYKNSSEYRTALRFGCIEETNSPIIFYFEKMEDNNE